MNLAEIRKKSESVKKGVSSQVVQRAETIDELFEEPAYENGPFPQESAIFTGEASEEVLTNCVIGVQVEEGECSNELMSETAPESIAAADLAGMSLQQLAADEAHEAVSTMPGESAHPYPIPSPSSNRVKSAGYNPLATIISGREWSAESEETSLYNALPTASGDLEEYLCFRVANEEYAISIMAIKEIIKPREVTEVPRMPEFISGVISLRGVIIPIMDMRLRLALPARERTGKERVVVLRKDAGFCGVLVDEVVQVAKINKADIEDPPAVLDGIDRDFVKGLGRFDKRMLILLNLDTILDININ
jgi:purine-binding chemotaxis protein CheW